VPPDLISPVIESLLRCPSCRGHLTRTAEGYQCPNTGCGGRFPIVAGVPVLLNDARSVFRTTEVVRQLRHPTSPRRGIRTLVQRLTPDIGANLAARHTFMTLRKLLESRHRIPRVLIIGGATLGEGLRTLVALPSIELIETDVTSGPRVALVCDAHDLPFADDAFHCVVAQAVLEHVVDPRRCVEEMHRVLTPDGIVYAETPFMQQVHLGQFDFSRFTHLGHRRLFRRFEEIESGPAGGPGTALAWAYLYFLLSFSSSRLLRGIIRVFASFTSFYFKYFDRLLNRQPGAYDAASGYYLIARKSDHVLSDRELLDLYRGAVATQELGKP
jgi:SAM-dependent methyltransferase